MQPPSNLRYPLIIFTLSRNVEINQNQDDA